MKHPEVYTNLLNVAQNAAIKAGDFARDHLGRVGEEFKLDDQIVTESDRKCQQMIIDEICGQYPDHGFIGEEGPGGEMLKIPASDREDTWWVIDPIDGTRNYAHGVPLYAVSLGAIQGGMPIVGVIYDPNVKMLFSATADGVATCNGKEFRCPARPLNGNSQIAVTGHYDHQVPAWVDLLMKRFVCVNLGSAALHYAYTAMGSFAATYSEKVKLWDLAAGAAINQAAGAFLGDLQGRSWFPFDCSAYNGQPLPTLNTSQENLAEFIDIMNSSRGR